VFLNDTQDHTGGGLAIRTTFGAKVVKERAGQAIIYPASSVHQVTQIGKDERLVAVTWMRNLVRDPHKRELLYGLALARESLVKSGSDDPVAHHVNFTYANLMRMWADI
jgi:PKHD-type hydroxylase